MHDRSARGPAVGVRPTSGRANRVPAVLLVVIATAWALALAAEWTGYADWVHHHELVDSRLPVWGTLALFFFAWQLHIAAMMLPSSLPLIALFRRASATQPRPTVALGAFLGGYALIWTAFGFVALAGDALLHDLVHRWAWLDERPRLIGGAVLLLAGAFQFSSLKDRCLRECRHPAAFLVKHYQRGSAAAFALGRRHGLFCLGCCWALMLVMFSVGIANLAWMAPFALLMLYEKTGPRAERALAPVGVALVGLGVLVILAPTWMPELYPAFGH
jgi:predicted metal-binding membrane protein